MELCTELLEDLALSDFHLFSSMKDSLHGERFDDRDEVKNAIKMWLKQRDTEFFRNGFLSWLKRWRKCIDRRGDYTEG